MPENAEVIKFHEAAYERVLEGMFAKDDLSIKLGDTLDVKASVLLAAITLIATQTAYFLDKGVAGLSHYLLIGAGVLLVGAMAFAFIELWPRKYTLPRPEKSSIDRVAELRDFYAQHENVESSLMLAEFTKDEIGWAQTRISENQAVNRTKSKSLEWSFYLTALAMIFNIATLLMRLF